MTIKDYSFYYFVFKFLKNNHNKVFVIIIILIAFQNLVDGIDKTVRYS
ncbi:hypothetical protein XIS1_120004 [Xenorhabdus innexi]|uniref:Uncharacterized protein n=1 Tax=Xenorhabdus innexi TaxID=290109 RepID=A0A1N6MRW4_9GAMM|nr:hypothetical protein XIS1_120004 [Xenorhabdus innexi]